MSAGNFRNIDVPPSLQKLNVSAMGRENQRFLIEYRYSSRDGIPITVDILFDIKQSLWDTLEEFRKAASKRPHIRPEQIQRIIAALRADEYCNRIFSYYEFDSKTADNDKTGTGSTSTIEIGESDRNEGDDTTMEEQEEAYASSVSDPDYTDEGLPLLSVSSAIRKDPMRLRVTGVIDTVGKPFKLLREINFRCTNIKCSRFDLPERCILDTPIYTTQDMPIAFDGGMEEYNEKARCPNSSCRRPRTATPNYNRFENAKVIQLKNLSRRSNGNGRVPSAVSANTTLTMEHLTVLVTGKHTLSVGLGEEVEMVGELYVLASGMAASRFGSSGGGSSSNLSHAGDSGRAQPILYAKRIKYTKRERDLNLTPRDIKAIKLFASFPNLIPRLVSMMSPEVYGNDEAKLGLLLTAAKGAPKQKDNWYRRYWINIGLLGDKGTAKTTLLYDAIKLIPGSQSVSGQHSTGKGIVAVADRVGGAGSEPMLRAGAAILANHALLGIDEIGTMSFEDQEQFLSLMDKGYFDFNKMGIRQRLESETGFIVTSNPMTSDFRNRDRLSLDEIPLKGQLIDRLDLVFVFRKPQTSEEQKAFAYNMHQISGKHFNLDFIFLRKYIYYIHNNPEFEQIDFEEYSHTMRLRDFWTNLISENPEFAGNRSFESMFKIAKAFARFMLKTTVDSEVIDQTIDFIQKVFSKHGTQIAVPVDYFLMAFLEMCSIIKKYSQEKIWVAHNAPNTVQLADISFNQAAEIAAKKNTSISEYMGKNFRSNVCKPARRLRQMFRESQDRDFDNGKIKLVSEDGHELRLRWIDNNNTDIIKTGNEDV
jgi:DNA replicative helicase MCM subunit Mcm2 (Cdc46/Mcm family)